MIALLIVCLNGDNHIAQILSVAELAEHQSHKLVLAGEMLDIHISIILVNKVAELVIANKLQQLRENVFVFVHLQSC